MNKKMMLISMACVAVVFGALSLSFAGEQDLLSATHAQNAVSCQDCHDTAKGMVPQSAVCIDCHGTIEDVAVKTEKHVKTTDLYAAGHLYLENLNPHKHHLGDIDCFSCHTVHKDLKAEESPCYECHTFTLELP